MGVCVAVDGRVLRLPQGAERVHGRGRAQAERNRRARKARGDGHEVRPDGAEHTRAVPSWRLHCRVRLDNALEGVLDKLCGCEGVRVVNDAHDDAARRGVDAHQQRVVHGPAIAEELRVAAQAVHEHSHARFCESEGLALREHEEVAVEQDRALLGLVRACASTRAGRVGTRGGSDPGAPVGGQPRGLRPVLRLRGCMRPLGLRVPGPVDGLAGLVRGLNVPGLALEVELEAARHRGAVPQVLHHKHVAREALGGGAASA
mmetsp:Transcript_8304/g.32743  ORF Transcript_8304/g.32743 Transcript_8304/m.32743 type:complete len:260 (-) Transcript_8304:634-1413(-)